MKKVQFSRSSVIGLLVVVLLNCLCGFIHAQPTAQLRNATYYCNEFDLELYNLSGTFPLSVKLTDQFGEKYNVQVVSQSLANGSYFFKLPQGRQVTIESVTDANAIQNLPAGIGGIATTGGVIVPKIVLSATGSVTSSCFVPVTISSTNMYDRFYVVYLDRNQNYSLLSVSNQVNPVFFARNSGKYFVFGFYNFSNCEISETLDITITNPAPSAPIIVSSDVSYCQKSFMANSGSYFRWFKNNVLITSSTNPLIVNVEDGFPNYKVAVSNDNTCFSDVSLPATPFPSQIPQPSLSYDYTPGNTLFSCGKFLTITASGGYLTYDWYRNDQLMPTSTTNVVSVNSSGTYKVNGVCTPIFKSTQVSTTIAESDFYLDIYPQYNVTICPNSGSVFTASPYISGVQPSSYTYQWYRNDTLLVGETNQKLDLSPSTKPGEYYAIVTFGSCSKPTPKRSFSVVDMNLQQQLIPSGPTTYCSGKNFYLSIASVAGYKYGLMDYFTTNYLVPSTVVNGMAIFYPYQSGKYYVEVKKEDCIVNSNFVSVSVLPSPYKPTITSNYSKDPLHPKACYPNSSTYLNTGYACSGCTINWMKDGQYLSFTNKMTINVVDPGNYQATLTKGSCTVSSDTIPLQTITLPSGVITVSSPNCVNEEITVLFSGSSSSTVNYDWNFYTTSTGVQILSGSGAGPYLIKYPSQWSKPIDLNLRDDICTKYLFTYVYVNNKLTVAPKASSVSRCGPGSVVLPVIIIDNAQNAYLKRWYDSPQGGNLLFESMGNFFTTPGLNVTTSFYVTFVYNGCEGPRTEVKATIVNMTDPSVIAPVTICGSGLVNLTNAVTSSDKLVWYSNLTTTSTLANPQALSVSSSAFYYVSAVQTVTGGSCFSSRVPVEIKVYSIPSAPLVFSGHTCGSGLVTLSASGANSNEKYLWNRNGVLVKTSTDYQDNLYQQNLSSNQVFTVGKLDDKGCKSSLATVTAQFFPLPVVGGWVSGSNPICKGGITSLSSNGASSYLWLSEDGTLNSALQNLTVNPTSSMSYTVTGTDMNGCSASKIVNVNVNITPVPTAIAPITVCGNSSFSIIAPTISGMSYRWYDSSVGGAVLAYGPILNRTNGVGSTTIYYVSQTDALTGCESERTAAMVVFVPLPSMPLTINGKTCGNGLVTLTALGAGWNEKYRWYRNGEIVKNSLDATDNLLVTTIIGANQLFQVSKVNEIGCNGELANVTANFYSLPLVNAWINGASVICVGGSVNLASNGAASYQWISNDDSYTSATQNPVVYPNQSATYSVTGTDLNGCTASRSVSVTVNFTEDPQVQPNYLVCQKMPFNISLSSVSGSSYKWYTQVTGGNPFYISSTGYANSVGISVSTTIFVSRFNSGTSCESIRLPILITPVAKPVISSVTQKSYCYGVTVLSATGASVNEEYYWYSNTSGTPLVGTGSSVTVNQVNTYLSNNYFVVLRSSVCESSKRFVSAKFSPPVPKLPSIPPVQLCSPGSTKISVGINLSSSFYCNWYSASVGGIMVYSGKNTTDHGASFSTPYLTKTTQWYVSRVNSSTDCESEIRTLAEVRIGISAQPAVSGFAVVTFPGTVTLSASLPPAGNSVAWFNAQGNSIGNGQSISVNISQSQTIYAAFVSWSPVYCEGPRQPFDITYDPRVVLSTSTTTVCANSQVTISANFPGPYLWQSPMGITTTIGNSFVFYPSQATTCTATSLSLGKSATININTISCPPVVGLNFDGSNDMVTINDNSSLNFGTGPFTFEAKIRSRRLASGNIQVILSKRNTTQSNGFMFGLWSDGHLWCQMMGAPNLGYDQGPTILDGQCHHVSITRSISGIIKFYIDGQMTYQVNSGLRNISDPAGPLRIGFDKFSALPFDGIIGEVRIWNYERTQSQIQANQTSQLLVEPGLVANYWLNGPFSSQNVTDASGYGNTGVLGSSTSTESNDPTWYVGSSTCSNSQTLREDSLRNTLEMKVKKEVTASPNPFSNAITVVTSGLNEGFAITVYDGSGVVVFEKLSIQNLDGFSLGSDWTSGIYFVRISDGGFSKVLKIVKIN